MLRIPPSYVLFLFALLMAHGQTGAALLYRVDTQPQHGQSNPCKAGSGEKKEWMFRMEERGIKSVSVEATFSWNSGVENISVKNLGYYTTLVTLTSGEESRVFDGRPDSDSFSKMLGEAAGPILAEQLRELLPRRLAKARLIRARGSIVLIFFDDPCIPTETRLGDLIDPDMSPLLRAASAHSLSRLNALLQDGADVNSHDQRGLTPLMAASFAGNVETVRLLLEHGARVNDHDIDGRTALHFASEQANASGVIPVLLKGGADANVKSGASAKYLSGATPLIMAASVGNVRAVEYLLGAGADPNALTVDRMTALDVARHPPLFPKPGHTEVIKLLENTSHGEALPKPE